MIKKFLLAAVVLSLGLFISCKGVLGKLLVVEGNYHSSRGRYTRAIHSYHRALAHEEAAPYAQAGLGTVYYSLDETKAALQRFDDSLKMLETLPFAEHTELRYRNNYNSGVTLFSQGDYSQAAASFRQALRIDPGRVDAKRNLELSLLSIAQEKNTGVRNVPAQEDLQGKAILFDYLGLKEQNQWKSREWAGEDKNDGPDY